MFFYRLVFSFVLTIAALGIATARAAEPAACDVAADHWFDLLAQGDESGLSDDVAFDVLGRASLADACRALPLDVKQQSCLLQATSTIEAEACGPAVREKLDAWTIALVPVFQGVAARR